MYDIVPSHLRQGPIYCGNLFYENKDILITNRTNVSNNF